MSEEQDKQAKVDELLKRDPPITIEEVRAFIKALPEDERCWVVPDDVCPVCFSNKSDGTCWSCYESPAENYR